MYARVSTSARLACDSSQSGTPSEINWYVTETQTAANRILIHFPGTSRTRVAIVHWTGCINAIKILFTHN